MRVIDIYKSERTLLKQKPFPLFYFFIKFIFNKNFRTYLRYSYKCSEEITGLIKRSNEIEGFEHFDNLYFQMKLICIVDGWVLVNLQGKDREIIYKGPKNYNDLVIKSWKHCLIFFYNEKSDYLIDWYFNEILNKNKKLNEFKFWSGEYFAKKRDNKLFKYQTDDFCVKAFDIEDNLNLEIEYKSLLKTIPN